MASRSSIGFIGLGVMGEPICRNLVWKSGTRVIAFDLAAEPLARLEAEGARGLPHLSPTSSANARRCLLGRCADCAHAAGIGVDLEPPHSVEIVVTAVK